MNADRLSQTLARQRGKCATNEGEGVRSNTESIHARVICSVDRRRCARPIKDL